MMCPLHGHLSRLFADMVEASPIEVPPFFTNSRAKWTSSLSFAPATANGIPISKMSEDEASTIA